VSVLFNGPINAPRRNLETANFVEWLTLRSVERETKRLEEIQGKEPVGTTAKPAVPSAKADRPPRPPQSPSLSDPLPLQPNQ
jgi:hypothetical protein